MNINPLFRFFFRLFHFFIASFSIGALLSFFYLNLIIVPEGATGIMINRLEKEKIRSLQSGSHFVWDAFVPEKYQIIYFTGFDKTLTFEHNENLKYTEFLKLSDYFKMKISVTLTYRINAENILLLYQMNGNKLNRIDEFVKNRFKRILEKKYYSLYRNEQDIKILKDELNQYLKMENPDFIQDYKGWFSVQDKPVIELVQIYVNHIHLPDYVIYREMGKNMPQIIHAKRKAFLARIFDESRLETDKVRSLAEYDKARMYSDLIKKNPDIIQFLQIDKINPFASRVIIEQNSGYRKRPLSSGTVNEAENPEPGTLVLPPISKENNHN